MKIQDKTIMLDPRGIDEASETIRVWLEAAGVQRRDILRIRLTMEELLTRVFDRGEGTVRAEFQFKKRFGDSFIRIRYDGERFDPTSANGDPQDEWSETILQANRLGLLDHEILRRN